MGAHLFLINLTSILRCVCVCVYLYSYQCLVSIFDLKLVITTINGNYESKVTLQNKNQKYTWNSITRELTGFGFGRQNLFSFLLLAQITWLSLRAMIPYGVSYEPIQFGSHDEIVTNVLGPLKHAYLWN